MFRKRTSVVRYLIALSMFLMISPPGQAAGIADATGRTVIAGPAEATAIGNVLIQAIGSGALAGLDEARAVVRRSFRTRVIEPASNVGWDAAYERYRRLQPATATVRGTN